MTTTAAIMEPISSKLRQDEKKTFLETCEAIGTTPSNAIRMFVSAFNRRGGFPFDSANPYGFSKETLQAMDDVAAGRNLSGPFSNIDDLMASLEED